MTESSVVVLIDRSSCAGTTNSYEFHFGPSPQNLSASTREDVDQRDLSHSKQVLGCLGTVTVSSPRRLTKSAALPVKPPVPLCY